MHIKILQLQSSIGVFGAENVMLELCRKALEQNIYSVMGIILNKHENSDALAHTAIASGLLNVVFADRKPFSLKNLIAIAKYVKKHEIDIVHSHGYKANFYAFFIKYICRVKILTTCHPWTETKYNIKARLYTFLDKLLLRGFDHLVAVSEKVRQELVQFITNDKVQYIVNGIDCKRYNTEKFMLDRTSFGIDDNAILIGTVGRLVPEKGYIYLLKAARELINENSKLIFVFVGDGPLLEELKTTAQQYQLSKVVRFAGNRQDIPAILSLFDFFILPSISEGTPMALLEAMSAAKPVIATNVGDIPKIIENEKNGLLIPPANTDSICSAVMRYSRDMRFAKAMGVNAQDRVKRHYSSEVMASKYKQLYQSLLLNNEPLDSMKIKNEIMDRNEESTQ